MHYFNIETKNGQHVGFLVMLADDETEAQPQSGRFAVKVSDGVSGGMLTQFEQTDIPQYWRVVKDRVELFFDDTPVGTVRGEMLTISGQTFVLGDMVGAV